MSKTPLKDLRKLAEGLEPYQVRKALNILSGLFSEKGKENFEKVKTGYRVEVYWPSDKTFYWGTVISRSTKILSSGFEMVRVRFDDDEVWWIHPADIRGIEKQ